MSLRSMHWWTPAHIRRNCFKCDIPVPSCIEYMQKTLFGRDGNFMGMVYRGYPQALQPYMLYRREEQTPELFAKSPRERRRHKNEVDYFKGLYPAAVRFCEQLVEELCDRLDYKGSPIYDEYPDRETICRMRNRIVRRAKELGRDADEDMTLVLLLNELLRRRTFHID